MSSPHALPPQPTWLASLHLRFAREGERSLLRENRHIGPLRVQRALYPEGPEVCQTIVLHPPSGIAGGDHLTIAAHVEAGAHAQLTTPGAGKWYRSAGLDASQRIELVAEESATLEWLPQETIVFDGAQARMEMNVSLAAGSHYIGCDVLCLGRRAAGEQFRRGSLHLTTRIERSGMPLWLERGTLVGDDPILKSPAGWDNASVCGNFIATLPEVPSSSLDVAALLEASRAIAPPDGARHGLTVLPHLLLARYLGDNSEAARQWINELWHLVRPALLGRAAVTPRIWNT